MKKLISVFLVMVLVLSSFGCSSNKISSKGERVADTEQAEIKQGKTLNDISRQIENEMEISMPGQVDIAILNDFIGLEAEDIEDFAGAISMTMTSADNFIAVKAKQGNIEKVKAALENRLISVQKSFENYLPDQYDKAKSGQVFIMGNYAFLIIIGRMDKNPEEEVQKAEEIVSNYFE